MKYPHNKIVLTEDQIAYIKANFFQKTNRELAEHLGLKLTTLRTRCYEMGLKRMELEYWTKEQVTYLKKYYRKMGDTEIAAYFDKKYNKNKGWTKRHIEKKRRYLKLKRTPAEQKAIQKRNTKNGMFKMCPVKAWETRGTVAKEGDVRIWPVSGVNHKHIKINGTFVKLARYNWEQFHNKKVRKGYCITFIDGDPLNCNPENLERITMKQNVLRNASQYHILPEPTKRIIQLKNKLQKTIKNDTTAKQSA